MERLKAEGDGRQRRSHHHRLDARPRNRGSIQFVVRLVRLGRLSADGKDDRALAGASSFAQLARQLQAYLRALPGARETLEKG